MLLLPSVSRPPGPNAGGSWGGLCSTLLHGWGLHHQIPALPFLCVNPLFLPALSGVPSWRVEGLFASHRPSAALGKGLVLPSCGATRGARLCQPEWAQPSHSLDPAQQEPRQGPQDVPTRMPNTDTDIQTRNTQKPLTVVVRGPYMISPLISYSISYSL